MTDRCTACGAKLRPRLPDELAPLLGTVSDRELARRACLLGARMSHFKVSQIRRRLGIAACPRGRKEKP